MLGPGTPLHKTPAWVLCMWVAVSVVGSFTLIGSAVSEPNPVYVRILMLVFAVPVFVSGPIAVLSLRDRWSSYRRRGMIPFEGLTQRRVGVNGAPASREAGRESHH